MKKRIFIIIIGILVLSLLVPWTGCKTGVSTETTTAEEAVAEATEAAATEAGKEITLRFWKFSWGEVDDKFLPKTFAKFEEEHPGVKIEYLFHPFQGFIEKYTSAFASGDVFDITYLPDEYYPQWAAKGLFADLGQFPDAEGLLPEFEDKIVEAGYYNDVLYGLPFVRVSMAIEFNKDLFDKAGVPYPPESYDPEDPDVQAWTHEKFIEVAQKLTIPSEGQYGWAYSPVTEGQAGPYFIPWFNHFGATFINEDGTAVGFDNDSGLATFEFFNEVAKLGIMPENGLAATPREYFYSGKAAMCNLDIFMVPEATAKLENVGATVYPSGPDKTMNYGRTHHGNVGFLLMAEACEHKELAWELMKSMASKENVEAYLNFAGIFGTRKDYELEYSGDPRAEELLLFHSEAWKYYAQPFQTHPKFQACVAILVAEVGNMLLGSKTPEQAWKDSVDLCNKELK